MMRFLISIRGLSQVVANWSVSDHKLVLLKWGGVDGGVKPFLFFQLLQVG